MAETFKLSVPTFGWKGGGLLDGEPFILQLLDFVPELLRVRIEGLCPVLPRRVAVAAQVDGSVSLPVLY